MPWLSGRRFLAHLIAGGDHAAPTLLPGLPHGLHDPVEPGHRDVPGVRVGAGADGAAGGVVMNVWQMSRGCCRGPFRVLCWIDMWVNCRWQWVCDAHDRHITR